MRYNDPVAALRSVSDLRPRVTRATAHLYYAVGGSCYRSLDLFDQGRACLKIGLEAAHSDQELAICHQRLAYTYWLQDTKTALAEAQRAKDLYSTCGDEVGRSTALVDIANFYGTEGRFDSAKELALKALQCQQLPPRNQIAVHQVLAMAELHAGLRESGMGCLERALAAAENVTDRKTTGNLLGFAGRAMGSLTYFEMAIRIFGKHFPFNALALALEKCRLLEDAEAQEETMKSLRAYCRYPAYQRFLDHVHALIHMGRFSEHAFDYSRVWERWRSSQTRGVKIL